MWLAVFGKQCPAFENKVSDEGSTHVVQEGVPTTTTQTFSFFPTSTWPVNRFLRVRVLGAVPFRTCHPSTETLGAVRGVGERQCIYYVVPFFSAHTHTSSSTTPRFTTSRALHHDQVESSVADCRNILPLGARLPRVVGRSSLRRMTISEFPLSLCVSFHVYPFFARALDVTRARTAVCPHVAFFGER